MARTKLILSAAVFALCACTATLPPSPVQEEPVRHQTPDDPNPDALEPDVVQWMNAVCAIEDPAEREKALKAGAERGWNASCPDQKTGQGPG